MHPTKPARHAFWMAFVVLTACLVAGAARAQDSDQPAPPASTFYLHNGDTPVVFLGDSITEQRMYTTLIETYVLARYPSLKVTFRNAGWGGDTSWLSQRGDLDDGLQRDVLALQPKVVFINFGMNDARGGDDAYSKYLESTTKLVKTLVKAGARVALITASPEEKYESGAPGGSPYNLMLKKYADGLKIVSDNEKVPYIDQYTTFLKFIDAGRKAGVLSAAATPEDPNTVRLTNDGVHPNWGGHLIMAAAILDQLNATDMVSSVTVDAAAHSIVASQGCLVEWQDTQKGIVQFKRADNASPWSLPSDPSIDAALKIPGFDPATDLNRYELKVTGLTATFYQLSIDNQEIDTYANADLAKGINLGFVRQGPLYDQGQQLLQAVMAKNDLYFTRWRKVQLLPMPDWLNKYPEVETLRAAEMKRIDLQLVEAEQNIENLRKPGSHIFKLEPVLK